MGRTEGEEILIQGKGMGGKGGGFCWCGNIIALTGQIFIGRTLIDHVDLCCFSYFILSTVPIPVPSFPPFFSSISYLSLILPFPPHLSPFYTEPSLFPLFPSISTPPTSSHPTSPAPVSLPIILTPPPFHQSYHTTPKKNHHPFPQY